MRGKMSVRIRKGYFITGVVLIAAFIVGLLSEDKFKKEEIWLFNEENVYETDILKSWTAFKKEHNLSDDVRIGEFSMTLSTIGDFESVKFRLADHSGKKYNIFNYQDCSTCPNLKDSEISVWKEKVKSIKSYPDLMRADDFFTKLEEVNQQKVFTKETASSLFLVRTRLWSDEINYPGEYYVLDGTQLNKIEVGSEQNPHKGYNLQILENTLKDFIPNENTINIIIGDKAEK
jgi:hypothetical protein